MSFNPRRRRAAAAGSVFWEVLRASLAAPELLPRSRSSMGGDSLDNFIGLSNNFAGKRAAGGPVSAGAAYLVGEKGPEILRIGSQGGSIVPNDAIGGNNWTVVITPVLRSARLPRCACRQPIARWSSRKQRSADPIWPRAHSTTRTASTARG